MLGSGPSAYSPGTIGSDLFVYRHMSEAGDRIWGFDNRPGDNDRIDMRPLFDGLGYTGTTPRQAGYLAVAQSDLDTQIMIDANGGGDSYATLLTLIGVNAAGLTDDYFLFQ